MASQFGRTTSRIKTLEEFNILLNFGLVVNDPQANLSMS
jgi:hypothetical protein